MKVLQKRKDLTLMNTAKRLFKMLLSYLARKVSLMTLTEMFYGVVEMEAQMEPIDEKTVKKAII